MCYTYDNLNRVITRTIKNFSNVVLSEESFTYDAAGNITDAPDSCFVYDTNNRLVVFNGNPVSYDMDGNMLSGNSLAYTYDSANRLISAGGHTYTYNAEDVRIRNLCTDEDTTYTYNTNAKLSMLLMKTTNGVVTKYVYGRGLIGEETSGAFKTYHFDCRGSTIAITDTSGNITDSFAYDTYGKCISHTGTSNAIFGYNGRDGVVTDTNDLIYMRARYYSPDMKRFINADIVAGAISNAITLNRFAYANGNPVSLVDPFGLSADNRNNTTLSDETIEQIKVILNLEKITNLTEARDAYITIFELLSETHSLYSVNYENELQLININGLEVIWKTKFNVGSGEVNYNLSKAIKMLKAKNEIEFWDETDLLKQDIGSIEGAVQLNPYCKWTVSLGAEYNYLLDNMVFLGEFTITDYNDYGDYVSNTLEFKKTIQKPTSSTNENHQVQETPASNAQQKVESSNSQNNYNNSLDSYIRNSSSMEQLVPTLTVCFGGAALAAYCLFLGDSASNFLKPCPAKA